MCGPKHFTPGQAECGWFEHTGEDFVYVLEGEVALELRGEGYGRARAPTTAATYRTAAGSSATRPPAPCSWSPWGAETARAVRGSRRTAWVRSSTAGSPT
ncbi:hypothetical protein [Streptomyces sennicomposti]